MEGECVEDETDERLKLLIGFLQRRDKTVAIDCPSISSSHS